MPLSQIPPEYPKLLHTVSYFAQYITTIYHISEIKTRQTNITSMCMPALFVAVTVYSKAVRLYSKERFWCHTRILIYCGLPLYWSKFRGNEFILIRNVGYEHQFPYRVRISKHHNVYRVWHREVSVSEIWFLIPQNHHGSWFLTPTHRKLTSVCTL